MKNDLTSDEWVLLAVAMQYLDMDRICFEGHMVGEEIKALEKATEKFNRVANEIEKSNRTVWTVTDGEDRYFVGFEGGGLSRRWSKYQPSAYFFGDKKEAEAVALLVGGYIAKV